jgi:hypothetical protein
MPAYILINENWVHQNAELRLKINKSISLNCKFFFPDFLNPEEPQNIKFWTGGLKGKDVFFLISEYSPDLKINELPLSVEFEVVDKSKTKELSAIEKKKYGKKANSDYLLTSLVQRVNPKTNKNEFLFCIYDKLNK